MSGLMQEISAPSAHTQPNCGGCNLSACTFVDKRTGDGIDLAEMTATAQRCLGSEAVRSDKSRQSNKTNAVPAFEKAMCRGFCGHEVTGLNSSLIGSRSRRKGKRRCLRQRFCKDWNGSNSNQY